MVTHESKGAPPAPAPRFSGKIYMWAAACRPSARKVRPSEVLKATPATCSPIRARAPRRESRLSVHSSSPPTPFRRGANAPPWGWLRPGARGPVRGRGRPGVSETWLRGESAPSHLMRVRDARVANLDAPQERTGEEQATQGTPPLILPCEGARRPPGGAGGPSPVLSARAPSQRESVVEPSWKNCAQLSKIQLN
jgi:hypothetical protein